MRIAKLVVLALMIASPLSTFSRPLRNETCQRKSNLPGARYREHTMISAMLVGNGAGIGLRQ